MTEANKNNNKQKLQTDKRSLGIYIHIPFCKSKCSYCNFVSRNDTPENADKYIKALAGEIKDDNIDGKAYITDSVYIGGGTPSAIPSRYISAVMSEIYKKFIVRGAEITIEANPESLTEDKIKEYRDCGINRISIGLQSASDKLLKAIGRVHSYKDFLRAYESVIKSGINNISADLMLGLPGQDADDIEDTFDKITALGLKHVSVYSLKAEEGTPLYESGYSPDDDFCADMYAYAAARLNRAGLNRYEVSNFAVPGKESRHNLKYWTLAGYRGYGAAAHSYINGKRFRNCDNIDLYINGSNKVIIEDSDLITEYIMLNIRTSAGINLGEFKKLSGYGLYESKTKEIDILTEHGLARIEEGCLRLTDEGFYVMNPVILKLL